MDLKQSFFTLERYHSLQTEISRYHWECWKFSQLRRHSSG